MQDPECGSPFRSRSRSRSPRGSPSGDAEEEPVRQRLDRHEGAVRDTRPAWMTKGLGVNTEMFGETKGDLVKPGLTQSDLEELERRVAERGDSPDPFNDFFQTRKELPEEPRVRRAPEEVLLELVRHTMSQGGFMMGGRLAQLLQRSHAVEYTACKEKFGPQAWFKKFLAAVAPDVKCGDSPEHGKDLFYLDADGTGELPDDHSPLIAEGDRLPVTGAAKREANKKKKEEEEAGIGAKGSDKGAKRGPTGPTREMSEGQKKAVVAKMNGMDWQELPDAAVELLESTAGLNYHQSHEELADFLNELFPEMITKLKKLLGDGNWLANVMDTDKRIYRVKGDCEDCRERVGQASCYQLAKP